MYDGQLPRWSNGVPADGWLLRAVPRLVTEPRVHLSPLEENHGDCAILMEDRSLGSVEFPT